MREITQMQINAARYANPLTLLPGNVPIDEHIDRLLENGTRFSACYIDLDHFKPYNDVYGYRKGDDMLRLTGKILSGHCDPQKDFVGHIGGDDFIILFQSEDWEQRCRAIIDAFVAAVPDFYCTEDRKRGGYISEDRRGKQVFHTLATISLGLVKVEPSLRFAPPDCSSNCRCEKAGEKNPWKQSVYSCLLYTSPSPRD